MNYFTQKRKLFIKTEEGRLPDTYQQVRWISSSGTQYIDTGIKLNNNDEVYIKFSINNLDSTCGIFGTRGASTSEKAFCLGKQKGTSSDTLILDFNNSNYASYRELLTIPTYTIDDIFECKIDKYTRQVKINNSIVGENTILCNDAFNCDTNCYIFKTNNYFTQNCASIKLYNFTIRNLNNVIHNYIPCYRKSDGEVGIYDLISQQFFINSGTGEFTKGGDING